MSLYSYEYQMPQSPQDLHDQSVRKILIHSTAALFSLFLVLLSSLLLTSIDSYSASSISAQTSTNNNQQLAIEQSNNITISLSPSPTPYQLCTTCVKDGISNLPSPTPTQKLLSPTPSSLNPTPYPLIPAKSLYTIAIIGDSMVDTMGEVLEYLDKALKTRYPQNKFLLYNYGTGAQNVEAGLARFGSHFRYQSRDYPSLPELKPDILIVGSFAYNPFTPHDRNNHWLKLAELVQNAKSVSSQIYLLAEIAPLRSDFGKGPNGVNWSNDANYEHSGRIIEQLENAVGLSSSLNVAVIDTFTPSYNQSLKEGNRSYVNASDGIHPSVAGHQFMAEKIAQSLNLQ